MRPTFLLSLYGNSSIVLELRGEVDRTDFYGDFKPKV